MDREPAVFLERRRRVTLHLLGRIGGAREKGAGTPEARGVTGQRSGSLRPKSSGKAPPPNTSRSCVPCNCPGLFRGADITSDTDVNISWP